MGWRVYEWLIDWWRPNTPELDSILQGLARSEEYLRPSARHPVMPRLGTLTKKRPRAWSCRFNLVSGSERWPENRA